MVDATVQDEVKSDPENIRRFTFPDDRHAEEKADEFAGIDFVSGPEDVDYESAAPKLASAAMLNAWAEEHPEGQPVLHRYKLIQTSMNMGRAHDPLFAVVKIVNLTDKAQLGQVPVEIRKTVQELFFSGEANTRNAPNSEIRMSKQLDRLRKVGYAYGVAGFVKPKLVLTRGEVKDPANETWVGNIALADLTEFTRICEGDDQLAARRLEDFSEE